MSAFAHAAFETLPSQRCSRTEAGSRPARLYGICDRKKWAEDAGAYNMLVTAWPEIGRLAATGARSMTPAELASAGLPNSFTNN